MKCAEDYCSEWADRDPARMVRAAQKEALEFALRCYQAIDTRDHSAKAGLESADGKLFAEIESIGRP